LNESGVIEVVSFVCLITAFSRPHALLLACRLAVNLRGKEMMQDVNNFNVRWANPKV